MFRDDDDAVASYEHGSFWKSGPRFQTVVRWKCTSCGRRCATNVLNISPVSMCCGKPAYNCDLITNGTDIVSETARLRAMREIEGEEQGVAA